MKSGENEKCKVSHSPNLIKRKQKEQLSTINKDGSFKLKPGLETESAIRKRQAETRLAHKRMKMRVRNEWLDDLTSVPKRDALIKIAKLPSEKANIKKLFALASKPNPTPSMVKRIQKFIVEYVAQPRVPFGMSIDQVDPRWLKKAIKPTMQQLVVAEHAAKEFNFRTGRRIGIKALPRPERPLPERCMTFSAHQGSYPSEFPALRPLPLTAPRSWFDAAQIPKSILPILAPGWIGLFYCTTTKKVIQINGNNGSATNTDDHAQRLEAVPPAPDLFLEGSASVTFPAFTAGGQNRWLLDLVLPQVTLPVAQATVRRSKIVGRIAVQPGGNYLTGLNIVAYWSASAVAMPIVPFTDDGYYGVQMLATSWSNNAVFSLTEPTNTELSTTDPWQTTGAPPALFLHLRISATDNQQNRVMLLSWFLEAVAAQTVPLTDVYITGIDCAAQPIWTTPVKPCLSSPQLLCSSDATVTIDSLSAFPFADVLVPSGSFETVLLAGPVGEAGIVLALTTIPSTVTRWVLSTAPPVLGIEPPLANRLYTGWIGLTPEISVQFGPVNVAALYFYTAPSASIMPIYISCNSLNPLVVDANVTNPVLSVGITASIPLTAGIAGAVTVVGSPATDILPIAVIGSTFGTLRPSVQTVVTNVLPIATSVFGNVNTTVNNSDLSPVPVKVINTVGVPAEVKVINAAAEPVPVVAADAFPTYVVEAPESPSPYGSHFPLPLPEIVDPLSFPRLLPYIDACIAKSSNTHWLKLWSKVKSAAATGDDEALALSWNRLMHALNGNTSRSVKPSAERELQALREWMMSTNKFMALAYFDQEASACLTYDNVDQSSDDEEDTDAADTTTEKPTKKAYVKRTSVEGELTPAHPPSAGKNQKDRSGDKASRKAKRAETFVRLAADPKWFACFVLKSNWTFARVTDFASKNKIRLPDTYEFKLAASLACSMFTTHDRLSFFYSVLDNSKSPLIICQMQDEFLRTVPPNGYPHQILSEYINTSLFTPEQWNKIMHSINGNTDGYVSTTTTPLDPWRWMLNDPLPPPHGDFESYSAYHFRHPGYPGSPYDVTSTTQSTTPDFYTGPSNQEMHALNGNIDVYTTTTTTPLVPWRGMLNDPFSSCWMSNDFSPPPQDYSDFDYPWSPVLLDVTSTTQTSTPDCYTDPSNQEMHALNGNIAYVHALAAMHNKMMHALNGNTSMPFENTMSPVPTPDYPTLALVDTPVWNLDRPLTEDLNVYRNALGDYSQSASLFESTRGDIRTKVVDAAGDLAFDRRTISGRETFGVPRISPAIVPVVAVQRLQPVSIASRRIIIATTPAYILTTIGKAILENINRSKPERVVEEGFFTADLAFYANEQPLRYNWFLLQALKIALMIESHTPTLSNDAIPMRGTLELLDSTWHTSTNVGLPRTTLSYNTGVAAFGEDCVDGGGNRVPPFAAPLAGQPSVYFLNSLGPIPDAAKQSNTIVAPRAWATLSNRIREQFIRLLVACFSIFPTGITNWDVLVDTFVARSIMTPWSSLVSVDGMFDDIYVILPMRVGGGLNDTTANQVINSWLSRPSDVVPGPGVPPSFINNLAPVPLIEWLDMALNPAGAFGVTAKVLGDFLNWFAGVVQQPNLPKEAIELARNFSYRLKPLTITNLATPVANAAFNSVNNLPNFDIFGMSIPALGANLPTPVATTHYIMPTGSSHTFNALSIGAWSTPIKLPISFHTISTFESTLALLACRRVGITSQLIYDAIGQSITNLNLGRDGRLNNNPLNEMLSTIFTDPNMSQTALGEGQAALIWSAMSEKYLKSSLITFAGSSTIADFRVPGTVGEMVVNAGVAGVVATNHLFGVYPDFFISFWTNMQMVDYCQPSPKSVGIGLNFPPDASWHNGYDPVGAITLTLPASVGFSELASPEVYPPIPPTFMRWNARVAMWLKRAQAEGGAPPTLLDIVTVRGVADAYYSSAGVSTLIASPTPATSAALALTDLPFLYNNKLVINPFTSLDLANCLGLGTRTAPTALSAIDLGTADGFVVSRVLLNTATIAQSRRVILPTTRRSAPISKKPGRQMFMDPTEPTAAPEVRAAVEDFSAGDN
jgi:hypothetical protein